MAQDEAGLGECSVGAGEECVLRLPIESSIRVNQAWLRTVLSSLTHPDWFSVCLFYQLRGEEGWRLDLNCGFLFSVPLVLPPELWSSVIRHVCLWMGPFIVMWCPSLSLIIVLVLNLLCVTFIYLLQPPLFSDCCYLSPSFLLKVSTSLYWNFVRIELGFALFKIDSDNLCLLTAVFRLFTFKVITKMD